MSVFNNGLYQSTVGALVFNTEALLQNETIYNNQAQTFDYSLQRQGEPNQGLFSNVQTIDFDGAYHTVYTSPVLSGGTFWCNICLQATGHNGNTPLTSILMRVVGQDGIVYSPVARFYSGYESLKEYNTLNLSCIIQNPTAQQMILEVACTQEAEGSTGTVALLNPSGGAGAFAATPDPVEASYYFINLKS